MTTSRYAQNQFPSSASTFYGNEATFPRHYNVGGYPIAQLVPVPPNQQKYSDLPKFPKPRLMKNGSNNTSNTFQTGIVVTFKGATYYAMFPKSYKLFTETKFECQRNIFNAAAEYTMGVCHKASSQNPMNLQYGGEFTLTFHFQNEQEKNTFKNKVHIGTRLCVVNASTATTPATQNTFKLEFSDDEKKKAVIAVVTENFDDDGRVQLVACIPNRFL